MNTHPEQATLEIPGIDDLEPIGRGGFGTVYRGWQAALRREVAVKVLDAPAVDAASERRFEREAMAMGSLSGHPNVVPVYDAGSVAGRPYLVMPLLRDGSLQDRLAAGPLPAGEVVRLGQGLADALSAAHAAGVLHRDVKPANVLRTSHGAPQLTDFGVAQVADMTLTLGGDLVATVGYAAPEVLSGEPATEASDVYSLGATLHAAARGEAPFAAGPDDTPMSLAVRVMTADPPDLRGASVPEGLCAVIERAMARDPAERYSSAVALRRALDDLVLTTDAGPATTTLAVAAVKPTLVEPAVTATVALPSEPLAPRPAARRGRPPRLLLALLALAVLGAAVIAGVLSDGDGDGGEATPPSTQARPSATTTASTAGSTTTAPGSTTTATAVEAPSSTAAPVASGLGARPVEATRQYYALMDAGRLDEGWASLSAAYRSRTGEASYRGFWSSIAGVEVLNAESDGELGARARLRYTRTDGTTSTEDVIVRFVLDDDGGLLVDDYRVG